MIVSTDSGKSTEQMFTMIISALNGPKCFKPLYLASNFHGNSSKHNRTIEGSGDLSNKTDLLLLTTMIKLLDNLYVSMKVLLMMTLKKQTTTRPTERHPVFENKPNLLWPAHVPG